MDTKCLNGLRSASSGSFGGSIPGLRFDHAVFLIRSQSGFESIRAVEGAVSGAVGTTTILC